MMCVCDHIDAQSKGATRKKLFVFSFRQKVSWIRKKYIIVPKKSGFAKIRT